MMHKSLLLTTIPQNASARLMQSLVEEQWWLLLQSPGTEFQQTKQ
nr:MAG TPA: hypothetical protein [Caudoviricetes sp.]